jgi:hypothetical protein
LRGLKASGSREASGLRVSLAPLSGAADRSANTGAQNFKMMANGSLSPSQSGRALAYSPGIAAKK